MLHVYDIAMRSRFRGITRRQGVLWEGPAGWTEWSPFLDYDVPEICSWLQAADDSATDPYPTPRRARIPVNCTIPALPPGDAAALAARSGCGTAKIKVAEPGQTLGDDLARVEAVASVVPRVRVDANGGWSVDDAVTACRELARFDLEYVEQPCRTVEELADLRRRLAARGLAVRIAADESIRRADDPARVRMLEAADVAVLKVQPLGGVRRCLEVAELLGLPVVVSSALETSVGLAAGLALAAALPELPFACGLDTGSLLSDDPAGRLPTVAGEIEVTRPRPDPDGLARCAAAPEVVRFWEDRLARAREGR